jgi:hypothetical protein
VFDIATPRVYLGGKSGPMDIADFIDLVDRNKRVDNLNWRRDSKARQLSHLCTLFNGHPEWGDARNVPSPVVPEFTQFIDEENRMGIFCRGWRSLLMLFIADRWIYPSHEIRKWLGGPMWDAARMGVE